MNLLARLFFLCAALCTASCNRERKMAEILDGIQRIEAHLKKEEMLREITDIVRIDSNIERMDKKLDTIMEMLHSPSAPTNIRAGRPFDLAPRSLQANLEGIETRLGNLETALSKLEQSTQKIDIYAAKIEEIESRTTQLKDDTNTKLRKIMNVITALYEMSKDMKTNMGVRSEIQETVPSAPSSGLASEFLVENLEELERKIKEQFSVLSRDLRSEIVGLKIVATTMGSQCNGAGKAEDEGEDEDWMTPNSNARSIAAPRSKVESTLDNLVESLGRSTREIREEIHQGMQEIDSKLNNLTAFAGTHGGCDPLQTSGSVQSVRIALPEQDVQPKSSPRVQRCSNQALNVPSPKSCADLRRGGATCDGIYVVFPKGVRAVRAVCDMSTDGGGWTVLMRRGDYGEKMTSFHKNWASYKNGFGDSEGEFWLGNDVMHLLTTQDDNTLKIHLSAFDGDAIDLDYTSFSVGNESSNYLLQIGLPTGSSASSPAANSLRYHNNHPFSTFDRKNDGFEQNCAATYKGGWWFNGCYFGFLTGEYFRLEDKRQTWQGIMWYDWKGSQSLKGAEMKIRPKNFTSRV